jgi:hypothetical protein
MPVLCEELADNGYAEINHGLRGSETAGLFDDYEDMIRFMDHEAGPELRADICRAFEYESSQRAARYYFEDCPPGKVKAIEADRGPSTDDKVTYHHGPLSFQRVREQLGSRAPQELYDFLGECDDVMYQAYRNMKFGAEMVGMSGIMEHGDLERRNIILRLLSYRPTITDRPDGLAELHFDRSLFTIALAEDYPGLVGAPAQNGYREPVSAEYLEAAAARALSSPITHRPGVGKFFLGAAFNRMPDVQRAPLDGAGMLLHGVVNAAGLHADERRHAAILFGHPNSDFIEAHDYTVPNKNETAFPMVYQKALELGTVAVLG